MVRSLVTGFAAALTFAAGDLGCRRADDPLTPVMRMHAARSVPATSSFTRRSYLDPGAGASPGEIGTGNRYVTDTAPASLGAARGRPSAIAASTTLPSRFNPPGRPEPLFEF